MNPFAVVEQGDSGAAARARLRVRRAWATIGWVLLPLVAALQWGAPSGWVESSYARTLYPRIALLLSKANGWAPFSLAESAAVLLLAVAAVLGVRALLRARTWGVSVRGAARLLGGILAVAGWVLLAFSLLWGLNYRRPSLAARLGIAGGGTAAELAETARWLARETTLATPTAGGSTEPTRLPYGRDVLMARVEDAYQRVGDLPPHFAGRLGRAKLVRASGLLSYLGLSGIFIPFTGEPNVNHLLPDTDLVFAVAHEKAHQRGAAPENEANFAAFLALHGSDDPYLRYCGALDAVGSVLGALGRTDPSAYAAVARLLAGRPMADRARSRAFWAQYRGPAERVSRRVNDLYLRANRVPGGVQSYGAVTDLLVGYYRDRIRPRASTPPAPASPERGRRR